MSDLTYRGPRPLPGTALPEVPDEFVLPGVGHLEETGELVADEQGSGEVEPLPVLRLEREDPLPDFLGGEAREGRRRDGRRAALAGNAGRRLDGDRPGLRVADGGEPAGKGVEILEVDRRRGEGRRGVLPAAERRALARPDLQIDLEDPAH